MRADDYDRFAMALLACSELYGKSISEGAVNLWWQALQRYDIELVEKAFNAAVQDPESGQFMPKPADIIKRIVGTQTDRSLIAWGKVLDAIQRVGSYESVVFDDGIIHAVIDDMGGWIRLCRTTHDELPFMQRRFCETYRAYANRPDVNYPAKLLGQHDLTNAQGNFPSQKPRLIGDQQRAMSVLQKGTTGGRTQIGIAGALPSLLRRLDGAA